MSNELDSGDYGSDLGVKMITKTDEERNCDEYC